MTTKNNKIIKIDVNGKVIDGNEADARLVKAELSREHFCCLNVAFNCTGCGECNGRVI